MGAVGAALLAMEAEVPATHFKGFEMAEMEFLTSSFNCGGCSNSCEVVRITMDGDTLARWGGRCGKWEMEPAAD